jgi:hypothetical protein
MIISILVFFCETIAADSHDKSAPGSEIDQLTNYPRVERFEQGSVQVDFPTLESWPEFRFLRAWLPVEVSLNGDNQIHVGSAYVQATTDINFDQRTVSISNLEVLDTKFPPKDKLELVTSLVSQAFQGRESIVPLDVLLRLLPEDFEIPEQGGRSSALNFEPPVILVSETPVKLLSIDKEPVRAAIQGTKLEYIVNTNWYVFFDSQGERWYVLNEGAWQQNNYLSDGGWTTIDKLPADFNKLPRNDDWQEVQDALPASIPGHTPTPFVISLEVTELILLDGAPRLSAIGNTGISYVTNTQSDLFYQGERWYFLVSGRWFSNSDLYGQWQAVKNLPDNFAQIPSRHQKGHVLYSVPGTRQAKLSLIEAALPHRVSVGKETVAATEVTWVGEPRFESIENTRLERGLNTPFQVIRHNNFYYLCYEGAWYFSATPTGPWKVAQQVPAEIYRIPATDPAYNVTFVVLDEDTGDSDEYVGFSYSDGYNGNYSTTVSVVYGTGWYYPSSVYWGPYNRPYYWHYWPTYGYNFGYHPVGAYYGGRSRYYYPWGGWYGYGHSTVTLTSPALEFNHESGSAWEGPLQTTPGDPANAIEDSLASFMPKKKVDGTEEFTSTSKDGAAAPTKISASSLYASTALSSNRFSGPGGEVYKREDEEWSQYDEGNWTTMEAMEQQQRTTSKRQSRPETQKREQWLPAHKRTLSRSELDQQELARQEGMENYARYRMEKESQK